MRIFTLLLLLVLISFSLAFTTSAVNSPNTVKGTVISEDPTPFPLIDGIDWDEWLESVSLTLRDWLMIEGIDWDEWLESIGFENPKTA